MKVMCVDLDFCGKVKTTWVEGAGEDKKTLSGEEVLFRMNTVFFGQRSNAVGGGGVDTITKSGDGLLHKSGQTNYVFSCSFPRILPSSFESNFGSIRYFLKGKFIFFSDARFFTWYDFRIYFLYISRIVFIGR